MYSTFDVPKVCPGDLIALQDNLFDDKLEKWFLFKDLVEMDPSDTLYVMPDEVMLVMSVLPTQYYAFVAFKRGFGWINFAVIAKI